MESNSVLMSSIKADGVDRRQFLIGTTAIAAMAISGMAVIHTQEAWGLETTALKPDTMRTLVKMARDIFPHDRVPDKFYAIAIKGYDEKAVVDSALKDLVESTVAQLDDLAQEHFKSSYAAVFAERDRVELLHRIERGPFFKQLRGDLVVSLYNQKAVWPIFGYEGESASQGGYLNRGFNDITWL